MPNLESSLWTDVSIIPAERLEIALAEFSKKADFSFQKGPSKKYENIITLLQYLLTRENPEKPLTRSDYITILWNIGIRHPTTIRTYLQEIKIAAYYE